MPNLFPQVPATDAQQARILAVFGDVTAYRRWLIEQVKNKVLATEVDELREQHKAAVEERRSRVETDLGGIV